MNLLASWVHPGDSLKMSKWAPRRSRRSQHSARHLPEQSANEKGPTFVGPVSGL